MWSDISIFSPQLALGFAFFLAAALYASVGHGGASAYLAVMGLAGMAPVAMKPIALVLNIAVSLLAFIAGDLPAPLRGQGQVSLGSNHVGLAVEHADVGRRVMGDGGRLQLLQRSV